MKLRRWRERRRAARGAYSLRRRLIASVLGASVVVWLVTLAVVVHVAWRQTSDVFDDALKEGARLVLALGTAQSPARAAGDQPDRREAAKLELHYQLVSSDGRVLRRAEEAPPQPFSSSFNRRKGYENVWVDGRAWRVYLLRAEGDEKGEGVQVQIGQPWDERLELLEDIAEDLAWPMLGLLMLLGGFCWFAIRRLLQPIERTAERIAAKSPDDLAPVASNEEPRELLPIVQALNLVLGRLGHALQAERRFTADAAHELRTPLAALRMRIQLMQRQQAAERPAPVDLQGLRDEVDRCTALTESLLSLARLDPERPESLVKENVDLDALFQRLASTRPTGTDSTLNLDAGGLTLQAHPALLESALRNLLDNAVRYGTEGGHVEITAKAVGNTIRIAVRDDGPGVSEADRTRLTERFFRVLGSGRPGSGLGLSIVARIAALHGAALRFELGIDGRGLGVTMEFPAR
ncbi:ATP-binding protein [Variovorax sp. RHLX14]|uniref:ATP-binding protein n=1 Tax=Variovorax sp. RHLX14 TaxID=1259731 RepID=UPI003F494FF5